MAAYTAAWLIGSIADMPTQTVTIAGTPTIPSGSAYYLYDAVQARSLVSTMAVLMASAGLLGISAHIQRNGYVYIGASAVFTVSWGVSTVMRDLLGFAGNLAGADHYVATLKSPLLWQPGKPETPMAQRLGIAGHKVPTVYQAVSPYSGKAESVSHGSRTYARYLWPLVDTDLIVTAGNDGGTWARWFDEVAVKAARWKLYREVPEDPASTANNTSSLNQPLGPYVVSNQRTGPAWSFELSKGFERTDARADIDVRCHLVEEYT